MTWTRATLYPEGNVVNIAVHNLNLIVRTENPEREAEIYKWFSARMPNWWFNPRVRAGQWDGYHRFYSLATYKLNTGFLPMLLRKLKGKEWPYNLVDTRDTPILRGGDVQLAGITLHDHQQKSVDKLLNHKVEGLWFPRGIIWLPTATGKTEIAAAFCQQVTGKALILVHKKDLLVQSASRISQRLGEPVGMIGDGILELSHRITVGMVQTLHAHLKEFVPFLSHMSLFVSDESHHLGAAKTFRKVASVCPAYLRVAVSATPFDKKNLIQQYRLIGQTGQVVYKKTPKQMADKDVVAQVVVHAVPITVPDEVDGQKSWDMPYAIAYDKLIVGNLRRNNILIRWVAQHPGPTLVIVSRLLHGRVLASVLESQLKEEVPFLWGEEDTGYRERTLAELGTGKRRIVVATIADEGVDVPAVKNLILAAGGKSETRFLQRVGRGMRKSGDGVCHVLDFLDGTNEFLLEHSKERVAACDYAGFEIKIEEEWGDRT